MLIFNLFCGGWRRQQVSVQWHKNNTWVIWRGDCILIFRLSRSFLKSANAYYSSHYLNCLHFYLMAHTTNNLPAMQEIQVQSLGREDPQEKEMASHSSILAWKVVWTEEPGGCLKGWKRVRHGRATNMSLHFYHSPSIAPNMLKGSFFRTKYFSYLQMPSKVRHCT